MIQLELPLGIVEPELYKCLDPQPPKYTEYCEDYRFPGKFDFFEGCEMDGHYSVFTVITSDLQIEPRFDLDKNVWVWRRVTLDTLNRRKWWVNFINFKRSCDVEPTLTDGH